MFTHFKKYFLKYLPFFCIFVLAVLLRLYRLPTLTTFGRDQGIDFATVKQMIDEQRPTLLGIKVSLADFHQGPVYLYILVPFFLLFQMDPIAGAFAAVFISALTLIAINITARTFFDQKVALMSSMLFAVSPEFVRQGNSPLYQHFLPLFVVVALFSFLKLINMRTIKEKYIWSLALGFTSGICLELHFLALTFVLALLCLLFFEKHKKIIIPSFITGSLIGVSPTLLFELRNQFLNTNLLIKYLTAPKESAAMSNLMSKVFPWIESQSRWFGSYQLWIGLILLVCIAIAFFRISLKEVSAQKMRTLFIATTLISILFSLKVSEFLAHYLLPLLVMELFLLPIFIEELKRPFKNLVYILTLFMIFSNLFFVMKGLSANHGYTMPEGWSLKKIERISEIIANDQKMLNYKSVNVASLLDGDARTYPLRYSLSVKGIIVDSPENYSNSQVLYAVSKTNEQEIMNATLWEISSFHPFVIGEHWEFENNIQLYRLEKKTITY